MRQLSKDSWKRKTRKKFTTTNICTKTYLSGYQL